MKVNSCCCGCSLRTGSLIIGWLGVFGCISQMFQEQHGNHYEGPVEGALGLVIQGTLLYGIYAKRPSWMLLDIVLSAFGLFAAAIFFIISIAVLSQTLSQHEELNKGDHNKIVARVAAIYTFLLGLGVYFTIVLYSYYKQLKEYREYPNPSVA